MDQTPIDTKPEWIREEQNKTYADLLNEKGEMLSKKQLEDKRIILDCCSEVQKRSRIKDDKK